MKIRAYDHVGIRVVDREASLRFYADLGFAIDRRYFTERVAEMVADQARINLIFNGVAPPERKNVLMDVGERWPGITHAAFIVDRMDEVIAWAAARGIAITEGPVDWDRRLTCFLRDPDGNVLEFNELKEPSEAA